VKIKCGNCAWWIVLDPKRQQLGYCQDAVARARKVVPAAVNLDESRIFAWGGTDCPCFTPHRRKVGAK
jgi:hypothetical protein